MAASKAPGGKQVVTMWQGNWNLSVLLKHIPPTAEMFSCWGLVSMTGPRREGDAWKISKWENGLPQTVDICKILPETEKVGHRNATDADRTEYGEQMKSQPKVFESHHKFKDSSEQLEDGF